ncbi:MAG: DsbA family protein [Myxococcaceae bacterium]|nr:DsbA family protein [Myxococcaceae bacterium]
MTLVIFGDHASTFTSTIDSLLNEVANEFKGDVRVVWKESRFGVTGNQRPVALAARAAHEQGRFWPMHELLNLNISLTWGDHTPTAEELERVAQQAGVDLPRFRAALASTQVSEAIEREAALADQLGVRDVPWVFVNGGDLGPVRQLSDLQRAVARALAEDERADMPVGLCEAVDGGEALPIGPETVRPVCSGLWVDPRATTEQLNTATTAYAEALRYAGEVFPNLRTMPLRTVFCVSDECARHFVGDTRRSLTLDPGSQPRGATYRWEGGTTIVLTGIWRAMIFDLAHEFSHAAVTGKTRGKRLPAWFDEGLAASVGDSPHCPPGTPRGVDTLLRLQTSGVFFRYTDLRGKFEPTYCQARAEVEAWIRKNGRRRLDEVLEGVGGGASFTELYGPLVLP